MRFRIACSLVLLCLVPISFAQKHEPVDPVNTILRQELGRSFNVLKTTPTPPYFISYELTDRRTVTVDSSFGALTNSNDVRTRFLDIDLRIGDYKLDSTHGGAIYFGSFGSRGQLPIEDGADALRVALWLETDRRYKDAVQRFESVKTDRELKAEAEDKSPDFSAAPAETHQDNPGVLNFERAVWEDKVRRYGHAFRSVPDIIDADVSASAVLLTRRYVNTEGAQTETSTPLYRLTISTSIRAQDGEVLPLHQSYMSFSPQGLPSDQDVTSTIAGMIETLQALQKAPVADAYTGPAILSSRASAVFFHEIFGHRIEGARMKDEDDAQTFKKKINQQVLPPFLSVYSDPTMRRVGNSDLVGYYAYDDEGVKAQRVTVVDKGTLKTFLMSRSPIDQLAVSNGHGRRQEGYQVAARQSNLVVSASQTVSHEQLKKLLLERIKAGNRPYGLLLDDIEGGFTFTSRSTPNSFRVMPTVVYRIYPDGREELVRGLDLIGTPLIAFSKVAAADDQTGVFNGICGAESGSVPVSAVAPGLLLDQIEVQRKEKSRKLNLFCQPRLSSISRERRGELMKSIAYRVSLALLALTAVAFGQDDVVTKAMRDELSRSMKDLRISDLDKPYFISYRIDDNATTKISATLGQLTDENLYHGRTVSVNVRVGDFKLDNSNFLQLRSANSFDGDCGCHSTIPLDDDYGQIRREIWLATDAAYKQSASQLAAKRSALEHRQHAKELPDFTPATATTVIEKPRSMKADVAVLEDLARDLSAQFRAYPEFLYSSVDMWVMNDYVRFVDSEGTVVAHPEPIVVLDVRASLPARDGQPLRDLFRVFATSPEELQKKALLARTTDLITRLKALSAANTLEQYNGPVLFEGEASAEVMAQVFAPAIVALRPPLSDEPRFEAQFHQVLSQFGGTLSDRLGARVLPESFDVTDDPRTSRFHDAPLFGAMEIDDEGSPSREVKIVENGILKSLLSSRTPTPQTTATTGSVRGSGAAPTNLFVSLKNPKTNEELRQELLSAAKQRGYDYGVIVRHTGDGPLSALVRLAASSQGGEVFGGTAIYKLFADGHEELVRAEIEPIPLNAFKEILAGGKTPTITNGSFTPFGGPMFARVSGSNSSHTFIVTSYVVPSLLFDEVSLKQPVGSTPGPPTLPSPLAGVR